MFFSNSPKVAKRSMRYSAIGLASQKRCHALAYLLIVSLYKIVVEIRMRVKIEKWITFGGSQLPEIAKFWRIFLPMWHTHPNPMYLWLSISSVQFSWSVMFDSLQPHELQHNRPLCPSPTHGVYSNSCPFVRKHLTGGFLSAVLDLSGTVCSLLIPEWGEASLSWGWGIQAFPSISFSIRW